MRRSFYFSAACGGALVVIGTSVASGPLQHYDRCAGEPYSSLSGISACETDLAA